MRKGNLVKHNVTGSTATVESVNSIASTFRVKGDTRSYRQEDFTVVPRKVGRPKVTTPTASTFLKDINKLRVTVATTEREAAINGVIGLINLLAGGK